MKTMFGLSPAGAGDGAFPVAGVPPHPARKAARKTVMTIRRLMVRKTWLSG
jgi:hypothetical protein